MEQVILWGVGEHANKIINKYVIPDNLFELVVDCNHEQRKTNWMGYKIQDPNMINFASSNLIVIGSEAYREEIEINIKNDYPKKKSIYINDFLKLYKEKNLREQAINHSWQLFGGETYAQFGDDIFVMNLFHNIGTDKFSYLDIGAHNPYIISNTALFYQKGCRGINVEANPYLMENFNKFRPDDLNLNVGIGIEEGTMPFYMIDEYSGLNSFCKNSLDERIKNWGNTDIKVSTYDIPVITLDHLIEKYCAGIFPDFLTIDIEGLDYSVLSNYDFEKTGPLVIDVEIMGDIGNNMKEMLEKKGYKSTFRCGANFIFVKSEFFNRLLFRMEN